MGIFRLYPGIRLSFEHSSDRKILFPSACFCWESRLCLRERDQNFKFGTTIGYGDLYLEFLFLHFKVYTLPAIIHDAGGAISAHSGKCLDYCYKIGRGPSSSLMVT